VDLLKRGDLVTVSIAGDYGKPRPALIIQSDLFAAIPSVTLLPLTSDLIEAPVLRLLFEPTPANGLRQRSHVMIDKALTVPRSRVGAVIGQAEPAQMRAVRDALIRFLDLDQD
jgi:mRNA interferase MazF